MSVRILHDTDMGLACLYDATSGVAFGPIFEPTEDGLTAFEVAELFIACLPKDARTYTSAQLWDRYAAWEQARREVEV